MTNSSDERGGIYRHTGIGNVYEAAIETLEEAQKANLGFVLVAPGFVINEPDTLVVSSPIEDPVEIMNALEAALSVMRRYNSQ